MNAEDGGRAVAGSRTSRLRWTAAFVISVGAAFGLAYAAQKSGDSTTRLSSTAGMVVGVAGAFWSFIFGLLLVRFVTGLEWAPLGVARTTIEEALRKKVVFAILLLLLVLLTGLPFAQDESTLPKYRVQLFLDSGLGVASLLLGLMNIFLACSTLAHELEDQRAFVTLTKPIGRGAFLLGKWLGLALLNVLLLGVIGLTIVGYSRFMASLPVDHDQESVAMAEEVLAARIPVEPVEDNTEKVAALLKQLKEANDPSLKETSEETLKRNLWQRVHNDLRSLSPFERVGFEFENLKPAVLSDTIQLQLRPEVAALPLEGVVNLELEVRGTVYKLALKPRVLQSVALPSRVIDAEGKLQIFLTNRLAGTAQFPQGITVSFPGMDSLQILYNTGSFEGNLARGLMLLWVRASFLGALGLCAAAGLGFPVACLLALVLYMIALISGFLRDSITYAIENQSEDLTKFSKPLYVFVRDLADILAKYSDFSPGPALSDGLCIPWAFVANGFLWVGLIWGGLCFLLAWLVFSRRELGRVQV